MPHSHTRHLNPCVRKTFADRGVASSPLSIWHSFYNTMVLWNCRWQERQHLRDLDDHILKDIGLTPDEIWKEVRKPFWRP